MVVGLQALHHGLCICKDINDSHEQRRPHNVEETQLGSSHATCMHESQQGISTLSARAYTPRVACPGTRKAHASSHSQSVAACLPKRNSTEKLHHMLMDILLLVLILTPMFKPICNDLQLC